MPSSRLGLAAVGLWWAAGAVGSVGTYQAPDAFVAEAFAGAPPAAQLVWLTGARRAVATRILGHEPATLRLRYWAEHGCSVWVLEETGKERPITAGFMVEAGRLTRARVLVYRETRGFEVRAPAFLAQYLGRKLDARHELDGAIDGISGATLSVAALNRMARLALYLAGEVETDAPR